MIGYNSIGRLPERVSDFILVFSPSSRLFYHMNRYSRAALVRIAKTPRWPLPRKIYATVLVEQEGDLERIVIRGQGRESRN